MSAPAEPKTAANFNPEKAENLEDVRHSFEYNLKPERSLTTSQIEKQFAVKGAQNDRDALTLPRH